MKKYLTSKAIIQQNGDAVTKVFLSADQQSCRGINLFYFLACFLFSITGCKKMVEVPPPVDRLATNNVYTTDATAAAVLTDVYAQMSFQNNPPFNPLGAQDITSISLYASLGADELTLYDLNAQTPLAHYRNDLSTNVGVKYWDALYPQIFVSNNAIEGLNASNNLTPEVKQQLLGEAKFIRGFCYFYLVNLYGDVPLVLSTDWKINASLYRALESDIWTQIITDLKEAQNLLGDNYRKSDALTPYAAGAEERVRPTKWTATSMLARAYLYTGNWANAEIEASKVINNLATFKLETFSNSFKKNSKEAIWQLQPVGNSLDPTPNTGEGKLFVLPSSGPAPTTNPVYLSINVVNAFEAGDLRKTNWTDSVKPANVPFYYAKKYKIAKGTSTQEYPIILRLAEQYLIRAEARAQLNNIGGAKADLNTIRLRAGLGETTANDMPSLLAAILHERQVELFTEWGHRWFDLKRTGKLNAIMSLVSVAKGGTWRPYQALFPISQLDIDRNQNLIQNIGYY